MPAGQSRKRKPGLDRDSNSDLHYDHTDRGNSHGDAEKPRGYHKHCTEQLIIVTPQ